ncbi:hemolysin A isoform X1 [Olea europaea subsp. europaea]|uniref:Hemolysin A isoform X1 n=1 Tax=Olea europaea subsp. europaea TaxID=158383 RepID=A0A8S0PIM7_OLEEU|nr:hemolysin A isoform X1 [Olea europaea subsp. europaea]
MVVQHILKSPISRFCSASISGKSNGFVLFSSRYLHTSLLSVRWNKAHVHIPLRSFAATKSELARVQKKKRRLDEVCLKRFQQYSRTFIQSWILQGKVLVDGKVVSKCGTPISDKAVLEIRAEDPKYVCRAGHNLEAAIEQLEIDVAGKVALDLGLSTGGFTDCLLQFGASFVYGVDVDMELPKSNWCTKRILLSF